MFSPTPTIGTRLTFGQRELRRPSLQDDVEQLEELVLFDSSRVDTKGRTYIDPVETGINNIPNGPLLYIISQLNLRDLSNVAQVSRRFNKLTEQYREYLYREEDFDTLMGKSAIFVGKSAIFVGIRWLTKCHPERKCTPGVLNWASRDGHTEIVKLLLAANKPCTTKALNFASYYGYTEIVKLLLAENKPCTDDALDYASAVGHVEIVKLLLAANKPCTVWALDQASHKGYIEIVRLLLAANKPCTVWAVDQASHKGYIEIVRLLVIASLDPM